MKKKALLLVLTIAVLIVSVGVSVHAQSVPCGTAGGPDCTPTPAPFQDRDSDTIDDANDACPDTFGDPANRGCPVEGATSTPAASAPLPGFPADNERCLIATFGDAVNIRQAPDLNAPVVGQLQPGEFAVVLQKVIIIDQLWYRIALGYVAGSVVRFNEPCDRVVPTVQTFPRAAYIKIGDIKGDVGASEGAPPPDFDCYRYVIIDGTMMCLQTLPPTITGMGGSTEGAPPPDTSCWYGVVVNGNFICLMRTEPTLTGLAPVGGTEGAPPPDTSCYYQVLVDGSFICLIPTPPEFGLPPGSSEAPPPPEPGTCYHLVIHEGQAYCLVTIPPVITLDQGGTEGAPPPDPFDCAYYVIVDGSQICLIPEDVADIAQPGTGDPIPQTREHILLAFNPPADPDACPQTTGLLLPAVQKVREAASRASASELELTPLMVLPPADPCAFEIMIADPNVPPTPTDDGGMQYEVDIIRIIPPTDPPPRPLPFGAPEEEGANEGAKCYSDGNGFFGCTVSVGGYSFSAWYDPETGGHTETCVPVGENGVSCS